MFFSRFLPLRKLRPEDIGKVFVRVIEGKAEEDYLLLFSCSKEYWVPGAGTSFITFRLEQGKLVHVGETGHFNQPWYRRARGISSVILDAVKARHDEIVARRLIDLDESVKKHKKEERLARKICNRSESWELIGSDTPASHPGVVFHIWLYRGATSAQSDYVIDFCFQDRMLTTRKSACTQEPIFGMDTIDADAIFGENGVINSVMADPKVLLQLE